MGSSAPGGSWNPLRRGNPLAPVYISVFLLNASESALHILVPPYLAQRLQLGPALIGIVVAAFGVASLLARLPVGAVYRLSRARWLILFGGGLSALAFALVPLVSSALPFAGLMALDGLGWSIATTTQLAVLVAARPNGLSTLSAMGWYSGFAGLGHTAAGAGGFIADRLGYDVSFLTLAAATALATGILVLALRGSSVGSVEIPELAPAIGARRRMRRGLGETWRGLAAMPLLVWTGVLIMFYINVINGVINTFHPLIALGAGLSLTQIGLLSSCRSWTSSFTRLGSGPLFARLDGRRLTTPLLLVGAASVMLIPIARNSFVLQIPLFAMTGLSRGLLRVTGSAQAFDEPGDSDRRQGLTAALLQGGLDLGKISGPAVGGLVAGAIGLIPMFYVVPLLLLTVYGALQLVARKRLAAERLGTAAESG
ncbi:MAG: MFS transporter [Actinomycetota bacterium]